MAGMGTKVRADSSEVYRERQVKSDDHLDHSESQREANGHCQDALGIQDCFLVPQK